MIFLKDFSYFILDYGIRGRNLYPFLVVNKLHQRNHCNLKILAKRHFLFKKVSHFCFCKHFTLGFCHGAVSHKESSNNVFEFRALCHRNNSSSDVFILLFLQPKDSWWSLFLLDVDQLFIFYSCCFQAHQVIFFFFKSTKFQ